MSKGVGIQYDWGTERPNAKLEKLVQQVRALPRTLAMIDARAAMERLAALRAHWIAQQNVAHIQAAQVDGAYNRERAANLPWATSCGDKALNAAYGEALGCYERARTSLTSLEEEHLAAQEAEATLRERLHRLAERLGRDDDETAMLIQQAGLHDVGAVAEVLGLAIDADEIYLAFYGLGDVVPLPDGSPGPDEFVAGWSDYDDAPQAVREAYPCYALPISDFHLMTEEDAWRWVRPVLGPDGDVQIHEKRQILEPYEGSAQRAFVDLYRRNEGDLRHAFEDERLRKLFWTALIERREYLRFYLRLHRWGAYSVEEVRQGLADFDAYSGIHQPEDDGSPSPYSSHTPSLTRYGMLLDMMPWPEGFARTDLPPPTPRSAMKGAAEWATS